MKRERERKQASRGIDSQSCIFQTAVTQKHKPSSSRTSKQVYIKKVMEEARGEMESIDKIYFERIDELAVQTLNLIETHSNRSDNEVEKLWDDPSKIFEMMRDKRNEMNQAWAEYYAVRKEIDELAHKNEVEARLAIDEEFKRVYMIKATEAFENELDCIRRGDYGKGSLQKKTAANLDTATIHTLEMASSGETLSNEPIDFDVLADCLGDGHELWTTEEKQLFIEESRKQNIS